MFALAEAVIRKLSSPEANVKRSVKQGWNILAIRHIDPPIDGFNYMYTLGKPGDGQVDVHTYELVDLK